MSHWHNTAERHLDSLVFKQLNALVPPTTSAYRWQPDNKGIHTSLKDASTDRWCLIYNPSPVSWKLDVTHCWTTPLASPEHIHHIGYPLASPEYIYNSTRDNNHSLRCSRSGVSTHCITFQATYHSKIYRLIKPLKIIKNLTSSVCYDCIVS